MLLKLTRSDFVGALFFILGFGIFVGHWVAERNVNLDHVMAVLAVVLMVLGAFLMLPANMKQAATDTAGIIRDAFPWNKKE